MDANCMRDSNFGDVKMYCLQELARCACSVAIFDELFLAKGIDISLYEEDATKEEEDNPAHDIIIRQVESLDARH
jgi:hypothetical protein